MVNEEYEKKLKKYNRLKKELNEEVEILKQLLNNNILYVDISECYHNIQNYKHLIGTLKYELDVYSDE